MGSAFGFMTKKSAEEGAVEAPPAPERGEAVQFAGYKIRDHAPAEVRDAEKRVKREVRRRTLRDRLYQLVDYAFVLLYGLLVIRFLLRLIAANEQAGFVQFINGLTLPFFAPFRDIVTSPAVARGVFDMPVLICLAAFLLLHLAVRGLLHVVLGPHPPPLQQG